MSFVNISIFIDVIILSFEVNVISMEGFPYLLMLSDPFKSILIWKAFLYLFTLSDLL